MTHFNLVGSRKNLQGDFTSSDDFPFQIDRSLFYERPIQREQVESRAENTSGFLNTSFAENILSQKARHLQFIINQINSEIRIRKESSQGSLRYLESLMIQVDNRLIQCDFIENKLRKDQTSRRIEHQRELTQFEIEKVRVVQNTSSDIMKLYEQRRRKVEELFEIQRSLEALRVM